MEMKRQWSNILNYLVIPGLILILYSCNTVQENDQATDEAPIPNVLVILVEELNFETLPVYGNNETRVPNIDQLSQQSFVFDRAYVTQPVCTPSRGSMLTGKYPHRGPLSFNNAWTEIEGGLDGKYIANPEIVRQIVPFTQYYPRDQIKSCYIGKWHIGPERTHATKYFDEYWSIIHKFRESEDEPHTSYNAWLQEQGLTPDQPDGTFGYKRMVKMAREFSRLTFMDEKAKNFITANKQDPWVMFYSPHEVHTPNTGPYDGLFCTHDVTLDSAHFVVPDEESPVRHRIRATKWSRALNESQKKDELARYYGKLYDVDKSVGAIIDHLKATGQYDNTAIIFTADHGSMVNRKGFQTKMVMFDHSSRVPFMIKMPGQTERKIISSPVSLIDLLPTVFDLQQEETPEIFDGKSLIPVIDGEAEPTPVVVQWHPIHPSKWDHAFGKSELKNQVPESVFRNAISQHIRCWVDPSGFKLVLSDHYKDKNQLYDLKADPLELRNLYYEEKYQDEIRSMERAIAEWQQTYEDSISLSFLRQQ